jgi:hypothetical protein
MMDLNSALHRCDDLSVNRQAAIVLTGLLVIGNENCVNPVCTGNSAS